ncbi:MAG: VOC family protein [Nitrospirae bacterium]|nr:VOC family protein [Nitrospirota bacterium]MBI3593953.1 VOC family protein [Nitrospirota bacterium]
MKFRLHHIAIQCGNLEKSLLFYEKLLELPVMKREVSPKGRMIVWLRAGDGCLELYGGKPGQTLKREWDSNGVGPLSLGLIVGDLDLAVRKLKSANVSIVKPPYEPVPGERAAMVSGPDGEEIVLLEKPVSC